MSSIGRAIAIIMNEISLFFIAILPPPDIQDYANNIKQYFAENYASTGRRK